MVPLVARVEDAPPASVPRTISVSRPIVGYLLALCLGTGSTVHAADDGSLSNLSVPGGRSGLSKILKFPESVERAVLMLDVTRVIYDTPWGSTEALSARLPELSRYLDVVDVVEDRVAAVSAENHVNLAGLRGAPGAELLKTLGLALSTGSPSIIEVSATPDAVRRRELLQIAGLDVEDVARRLNANETLQIAIPTELIPLPLTPGLWSEAVFKKPIQTGSLFGAIVRDRRAALLYYGLAALDRPTLDYFAAHPDLVSRIYRESAPIFATFGRSLRVREGRIDPPGGQAAAVLWEGAVGESVSEPDRFIPKLFDRDQGRLALFYDTVAHLDRSRLSLALGSPGEGQKGRFATLAKVSAQTDGVWKIDQRPFARNPYDPAMLLAALRVSDSGAMAPPNRRRFWTTVFETARLPEAEARLTDLDADGLADGAWIAERVCLTDAKTRIDRFETVQFAQRVFGQTADSDALSVITALRALPRYRGLMLTLERIGVSDPGVYASAARAAAWITAVGEPGKRAIWLASFQGALTLVERARFVRSLDAGAASALVQQLSTAVVDGTRKSGGLGAWVSDRLLPALQSGKPFEPSTGAETLVLSALAGPRSGSAPLFDWEDMAYRLDRGAASLRRLREARRTAGGNELDAILELSRHVSAAAADREPARALKGVAEMLRTATSAMVNVSAIGQVRVESTQAMTAEAIADAARLGATDVTKAAATLDKLGSALETLWSDVLLRLAYVGAIGSLGTEVSNARQLVTLHDFGFEEVGEHGARAPWQMPEEMTGSGVPSHLQGSLLGLDLGLAPLALRRMMAEPPDQAPTLNQNDTRTFTQNVVLMNPSDLTDESRDAIARAIEAGRARIDGIERDPSTIETIARDIQLSEWRVSALRWMSAQEPQHVDELFSLGELFWLGRPSTAESAGMDAWGTPDLSAGVCLCTRFPRPEAWENYGGRPMTGQLAARMPDLNLRIAVALTARKLPASLARDVMALATQDLVDGVQAAYADDWPAMVRYVRSIREDRFDDYISSVAADGPLVPVMEARPPSAP